MTNQTYVYLNFDGKAYAIKITMTQPNHYLFEYNLGVLNVYRHGSLKSILSLQQIKWFWDTKCIGVRYYCESVHGGGPWRPYEEKFEFMFSEPVPWHPNYPSDTTSLFREPVGLDNIINKLEEIVQNNHKLEAGLEQLKHTNDKLTSGLDQLKCECAALEGKFSQLISLVQNQN